MLGAFMPSFAPLSFYEPAGNVQPLMVTDARFGMLTSCLVLDSCCTRTGRDPLFRPGTSTDQRESGRAMFRQRISGAVSACVRYAF